jgi:hypothetical protein
MKKLYDFLKGLSAGTKQNAPQISIQDLISQHDESYVRWTEEQISEWLQGLGPLYKEGMMGTLIKADALYKRYGLEAEEHRRRLHKFACKMRIQYDEHILRDTPKWYEYFSEAAIGWTIGGIITGTKKIKVE